jgi:hypothetical protein
MTNSDTLKPGNPSCEPAGLSTVRLHREPAARRREQPGCRFDFEVAAAPSAATPIIAKVITQIESEDGWVALGEVGKQLANLASDFDPRTLGFRRLSDLVRKTNAFGIQEQPKGGSMRIRKRSAAGSAPKSKSPGKTDSQQGGLET